MTTITDPAGVRRDELERENERAAAAIVLRRSPTPIAMPLDMLVDLVCDQLELNDADRRRRTSLITLHLGRELPKNTQLRTVEIAGEDCLTLSEWSDGQASLFAIPDADQASAVAAGVIKPPDMLKQVSALLFQTDYEALVNEAARREWSLSHMLRWLAREWRESQDDEDR